MRSFALLAFVAAALASPVTVEHVKRQTVGDTANEFVSGGCRNVIFIFSRGSSESGNMGSIVGPPVANDLKTTLGDSDVAAQGVDYAAALDTNLDPGGADPAGISTMVGLINNATSQCSSSKIVLGGYSQGAAMTHRAVEQLSSATVSRITGITLFGDTQYQQSGGVIGAVPASKVKIYCADGDLVCNGTLIITAAHFTYGDDASDASSFLASLVNSS